MNQDIQFLADLEEIIQNRLSEKPDASYTARLAADGDQRVAQKVGEEAVELAIAAVSGDRKEQLDEAADLVFHLMVLLSCKGLTLGDVVSVLVQRHSN
jgi:phosphoribosyl-ATP pyrophosphohydrolase